MLSLLATGLFVTVDTPFLKQKVQQGLAELQQNYPTDLQISWDQKVLTSTATQPITVKYPSFFHPDTLPENFGYIDTQASSVDDVFKKVDGKSFFVVTKDQAYVSDDQTTWSNLPLNEMAGFDHSFTITKQNLPDFITTWQQQLSDMLSALAFVYPIGYFVISTSAHLLGLLINSLFAFYILRLLRRRFAYIKIFQIFLHVSVIAEFVQLIAAHLFPQSGLPMYTITFWGFALVIFHGLKHVSEVNIIQLKKPIKK